MKANEHTVFKASFPSESSLLLLNLNKNNEDSNVNEINFDMQELSKRIKNVKESSRIEEEGGNGMLNLPVISFDSLLPNQKLVGSTTDPTFCKFLRDIGLGGLFVMVSLNYSARKLRRNGVLVKITIVDAKNQQDSDISFIPTSVDFEFVGLRRCRVLGPCNGMKARVGRWRRSYDPDGEESRLGWGEENFVDYADEYHEAAHDNIEENEQSIEKLSLEEWNYNEIDCSFNDNYTDAIAISNDDTIVPLANSIIPLLDEWYNLATNIKTYENVDVVATTRAVHGYPDLRVDPKKLLDSIELQLGEQPNPSTSPTNFALWVAAYINPVPQPLGVSPEIRGRVLEAPNVKRKLEIVRWGIERSILNLNGTLPLY